MIKDKSGWPIKEVTDWEDFTSVIQELDRRQGKFVYRGQENATWSLKPSLARIANNFSVAKEDEVRVYNTFHARSAIFLHPNLFNALTRHYNVLLWWAVMQHHGAPTRILDWSKTPFVAAYFACNSGNGDGAVWSVNRTILMRELAENHIAYTRFNDYLKSTARVDDVEERDAHLFNEQTPPIIIMGDTIFLTDRMERQQGLFSFGNLPNLDHASIISDVLSKDLTDGSFLKIIVPGHLKRIFMHQLQIMNITGFTLFPDLDGIGRYCTDIAQHRLDAK